MKPTLSENTLKIQQAYNSSNIELFRSAIEETSSYEKFLGVEKFRELKGSEKQIAWAKEIRETNAKNYAYQKSVLVWDMNAQKRGEKGTGVDSDFELVIKKLDKSFSYLYSDSASLIISNR